MTLDGFPRSYHVLYWTGQALALVAAVGGIGASLAGVESAWWWYLAVLPSWIAYGAGRLVARAHFRRNEAKLEQLRAEIGELQVRLIRERMQ